MAVYTRLQGLCVLERCLKFQMVPKMGFHSLSRPLKRKPPAGTRSFILKLFKKPTQHDLKVADDIPDTFEMIYRNTMNKYILGAQIVSLVTGGVVLMALLLKTDYQDYRRETLGWNTTARTTEHEEIYYTSVLVIVIVLIQMMVAKTPIRIYKVPHTPKYIAINYGNYFFGKTRYSFKRGEIVQVPEKGILPWKGSKYVIESETDRKSLILLEHFFRKPADLSIMLGEQKDPDLEEAK